MRDGGLVGNAPHHGVAKYGYPDTSHFATAIVWELLMLHFRSVVFVRHHGCQVTQSRRIRLFLQSDAFPANVISTRADY